MTTLPVLSADAILDATHQPRPPEPVDVPGLGRVFVPRFNGAELSAFWAALENVPDDQQAGAQLARMLVGEKGERLFGDDKAYDLNQMKAEYVNPIRRKFREVNGLDAGN